MCIYFVQRSFIHTIHHSPFSGAPSVRLLNEQHQDIEWPRKPNAALPITLGPVLTSLIEKKFYACRPLSECEEGMLSKRVFWREDINPRDFDPNDQNRSGLAATTMAPVNGLNGESEWCEWTTAAGQSKVHFMEGCARDDGKNARLKRYCSPSNSFLNYTGRPYDKIFVNPMYSEAQRHLDQGQHHVLASREAAGRHPEASAILRQWVSR